MASKAPQMPSVPTPTLGNAQSVHDTLMAMKNAIDMMLGMSDTTGLNRTFVQEDTPVAFVIGDGWVRPSVGRLNYWNGTSWVPYDVGA